MPVEVVTAAQRLSVIYTLKGCGGEGARVDRDFRLPVHWREQRSKPRSKEVQVSTGRSFATHYPSSLRASQFADFPATGLLPLRIKHGHTASKRTDPKPRADICQWLRCNRILLNPTPSTYRAARRLGQTLSFSSFPSSFTGIGQPAT